MINALLVRLCYVRAGTFSPPASIYVFIERLGSDYFLHTDGAPDSSCAGRRGGAACPRNVREAGASDCLKNGAFSAATMLLDN